MKSLVLPTFRYHPDPVSTGSVILSDARCVCCGKVRGYIYAGPVFAEERYEQCICPWCTADGSAHEQLEAHFQDPSGIGGYGDWDQVPRSVVDEVAFRTPGFCGWQQERWWTHCGEAAQYLGRAGRDELQAAGPVAIAAIRQDAGIQDHEEWAQFFDALDADAGPTAYLFKCLRCGQYGGYQDCH